jgi:hypothetical protein
LKRQKIPLLDDAHPAERLTQTWVRALPLLRGLPVLLPAGELLFALSSSPTCGTWETTDRWCRAHSCSGGQDDARKVGRCYARPSTSTSTMSMAAPQALVFTIDLCWSPVAFPSAAVAAAPWHLPLIET